MMSQVTPDDLCCQVWINHFVVHGTISHSFTLTLI
jgi:hypothetical protein